MPAPIAPISGISAIQVPVRVQPLQASEPGLFQAVLNQSIGTVQQSQSGANASVDRFLAGEGEELHQVALATQQAELNFELFLQVRNKAVQAYQEIMRMQI